MASAALPTPAEESIGLDQLERACESAAAAAMSAGGPQEAIDDAVKALHTELDGAGVCAFVLEHERLWSVAVRGYAMIPDGLPLDEGVIGRAVSTATAQLAVDTTADPDFVPVWKGAVSNLVVPLSTPEGVVGVINIETGMPLVVGADTRVAALVRSLSPRMDELRSAAGIDLFSLARLFVYIASLRDPHAIADATVRSLGRIFPVETSQLLLADDADNLVEVAQWQAATGGPAPLTSPELRTLRGRISAYAAFDLLDTARVPVPETVRARARTVVLIPLRASGKEIGLLVGTSRVACAFDRGRGELAGLLSAHAAVSIDTSLVLNRVRESAHTDALTGLLNRRGLEEALERRLESCLAEGHPVSVIVFDCDDFKDVNDRAGHETGDMVIREIGATLGRSVSGDAFASRLGGDEFVVALPGADSAQALSVAERVRGEIEAALTGIGFPLRLSAGSATAPDDAGSVADLLRDADQALYRAKATGKNRVLAFHEVAHSINRDEEAGELTGWGRAPTAASGVLSKAMEAAESIWAQDTVEAVLESLCKSLTFVVGATVATASTVEGPHLVDVARHSTRDRVGGNIAQYVISDFPRTVDALATGSPRAVSLLDDAHDPSEAVLLRELGMCCVLLVPIVIRDSSFGLVEIYDQRLRRFTLDDGAVASFLARHAGRRIESLKSDRGPKRQLPLRRVSAG